MIWRLHIIYRVIQLNFVLAISGPCIPFFVYFHFLITFFGLFRNKMCIMLRISRILKVAVFKIDKATLKNVIEKEFVPWRKKPLKELFSSYCINFLRMLYLIDESCYYLTKFCRKIFNVHFGHFFRHNF